MSRVIASVFARTREQVVRDARRAAMLGADWLELRLDHWPLHEDLASLFDRIGLPVLVACRTPDDGGGFRGSLTERRELLTRALQAGAQGLDLEQWESWNPPAGGTRLKLRVRSFHSFTGVPKDLARIRDELAGEGTVAKVVVTAHDLADAAPVFELLGQTDQQRTPTVAFAMGRTAWPTRILAAAMGAPFVYGSLARGEEVVADQLPVDLLVGLYRVRELGPATRWFGLLGNPALHSLGPWLHNRAFRRLGVDAVYLPFETSRPEAVLDMLPAGRLAGVSVTAPFKQRLLDRCARLSDEARGTGAVNTMIVSGDGMVGYNTDVLGVREALATAGAGREPGQNAVVLGAGGAARAAAYALRELGYDVTMLGRSLDSARAFAEQNGVHLGSLSEQVVSELDPAVIVHATPVGSHGRDEQERLLPGFVPRPGAIVLDMVYRPPSTRLLRDCAAAGAVAVSGTEMFLAQARAQVSLFTGKDLSVDELRRFLAGSLLAPAAPAP